MVFVRSLRSLSTPLFQHAVLLLLLLGICMGSLSQPAEATELPQAVMTYLQTKDPDVKVRFDGMVTFPNGQVYLPILPQDPSQPFNPSQVMKEWADNTESDDYPNLIQFDNNLFLIRLINTASGKLALAKVDLYPIQLKEGLLPQDLLLPPNLYIPTELKVILGDLPYDPKAALDTLPATPDQIAENAFNAAKRSPIKKTLYLADIDHQTLAVIDPASEQKTEDVPLNCVASDMIPSSEGHAVYISCLTTNEVIVLDTHSNLIKARVPVGSKPSDLVYIPSYNKLLVSHRYSNFLSVVDTKELISTSKILLPGNGGRMMHSPLDRWLMYVADYSAAKVYEVNWLKQTVVRTLPGLKNMTAIWVDKTEYDKTRLFMTSRTSGKLVVLDLETGDVLANLDVGKKPVAMVPVLSDVDKTERPGAYADQPVRQQVDRLAVVSAEESRLDLIDLKTLKRLPQTIQLPEGVFPTGIVFSDKDQMAYVATAQNDQVFVVDLKNNQVEGTLPIEVRAMGLALIDMDTTTLDATSKDGLPPEVIEEKSPEEIMSDVDYRSSSLVIPQAMSQEVPELNTAQQSFSFVDSVELKESSEDVQEQTEPISTIDLPEASPQSTLVMQSNSNTKVKNTKADFTKSTVPKRDQPNAVREVLDLLSTP